MMKSRADNLDQWRFEHGIPDVPLFITELSKYKLYNPSKANLMNGDVLHLVRRPDNEDDPNAVEVMKADGQTFLGYLPREVASVLSPALAGNTDIMARFHVGSEVASGMVVISGEDLDPVLDDIKRLSDDETMDTGIYVKPTTSEININWYNQNAALYDNLSNRCSPKNNLHAFMNLLKPGARILDAGCGNGRDLETLRSYGFDARGFDASVEMCKLTSARMPDAPAPRLMRFEDFDDAPDSWDGIWAMASLVHVSPEHLSDVVMNMHKSLKPGGVFFACLKCGDEHEVVPDGRRMIRISEERLNEIFSGFGELTTAKVNAKNSAGQMDSWITVMFMKAPEPELRVEM